MNLQLFSSFESDELFGDTVWIWTDVVTDFVMIFQILIAFVVDVFVGWTADWAVNMFNIDVDSELVLIEKVFVAEFAVGMHEGHISWFIEVSSFEMFVKGLEGVEFLFLNNTSFLFEADVTNVPVMILFKMFFKEG